MSTTGWSSRPRSCLALQKLSLTLNDFAMFVRALYRTLQATLALIFFQVWGSLGFQSRLTEFLYDFLASTTSAQAALTLLCSCLLCLACLVRYMSMLLLMSQLRDVICEYSLPASLTLYMSRRQGLSESTGLYNSWSQDMRSQTSLRWPISIGVGGRISSSQSKPSAVSLILREICQYSFFRASRESGSDFAASLRKTGEKEANYQLSSELAMARQPQRRRRLTVEARLFILYCVVSGNCREYNFLEDSLAATQNCLSRALGYLSSSLARFEPGQLSSSLMRLLVRNACCQIQISNWLSPSFIMILIMTGAIILTMNKSRASTRSKNSASSRAFRKKFGRFPDEHRVQIYEDLLGIPLNAERFVQISRVPIEAVEMPSHLPVKSRTVYLLWRQVVGYLCNFLGCQPMWLPEIVHPWVRLMQRHTNLQVFEVCLSVVSQYYLDYFENYPNSAQFITNVLDEMFSLEYEEDERRLSRLGIRFSKAVWPTLISCMSSTTTEAQWETIWDYLLASEDQTLLIPFAVIWGQTLLKGFRGKTLEELHVYMGLEREVDCLEAMLDHSKVLSQLYKLKQRLKSEWVLPLSKGRYPELQIKTIFSLSSFLGEYDQFGNRERNMLQTEEVLRGLDEQINKLKHDLEHDLEFAKNDIEASLKSKHNKQLGLVEDNISKINQYNEKKLARLSQLQKEFNRLTDQAKSSKEDLKECLLADSKARRKVDKMQSTLKQECEKVRMIEQRTFAELRSSLESQLAYQRTK